MPDIFLPHDELFAVHQTECIIITSGDNMPDSLYTLESPDPLPAFSLNLIFILLGICC